MCSGQQTLIIDSHLPRDPKYNPCKNASSWEYVARQYRQMLKLYNADADNANAKKRRCNQGHNSVSENEKILYIVSARIDIKD